MLLTITYRGEHATDLGYLLHKNPNRPQEFELNYGKAYVFYPKVQYNETIVALLLDMDPVELARGKVGSKDGGLFDYVNDRPYVCSSFMSTAISKVFGTAMSGRCDKKQQLADSKLYLEANIYMLPCRGDTKMLNNVFNPLGYEVNFETFNKDEKFLEWGESEFINLSIKGNVKLSDMLNHIYVLIPVFDKQKHYWIYDEEVQKLLRHGEGWLLEHPYKEFIVGRYLSRKRSLVNKALENLLNVNDKNEIEDESSAKEKTETNGLNELRYSSVIDVLRKIKAKSVIDLGCGEGKLLSLLIREESLERIAGVDVSFVCLERARRKLNFDYLPDAVKNKLQLFQGSLTYRDKRFEGYEVACVVEVIEHMDLNRLATFKRVLFEFSKPKIIVITTPNKDYNVKFERLDTNTFRHTDHRFEWTRAEFQNWAAEVAREFNYIVKFFNIGEETEYGSPTQMGVFSKCE